MIKRSKKILLILVSIGLMVFAINIFYEKAKREEIALFTEISNGMSKNRDQLKNTPGIIFVALAADSSNKLFKVGVHLDPKIISQKKLKEVVEEYMRNSMLFIGDNNWKIVMKPFGLRIEEIEEISEGILLGEKYPGSIEILWTTIK